MVKSKSSPKPDSFIRRAWRVFRRAFIILFLLQLFYIILLKWVNPPITMTQLVSWINGDGLKRDYVSSRNISPNARLAVIASEDQRFADHNGFDWKSIRKAMANNEKRPNKIRGASTISQQVAKNVFLGRAGPGSGRDWKPILLL